MTTDVQPGFLAPLGNAWRRMVRLLFRPFRLEVWLVLGFAAFLDGLDGRGGGGSIQLPPRRDSIDDLRDFGDRVLDLLRDPFWLSLIVFGLVAAMAIGLVLLWLNSRGKFVFLDDVLRERVAIVEPWRRTRRLGHSLFLWRIVFGLICLALLAVVLSPFLPFALGIYREERTVMEMLGWLVVGVPLLFLYMVVVMYIYCFLESFVIPLMLEHDESTSGAWRRFLRIFRRDPGSFLVYGLLRFALWIAVAVAVLAAGLLTCCCGFILLALPYVGTVILLPVYVTLRGFGPDFLGQFDRGPLATGGVLPRDLGATGAAP